MRALLTHLGKDGTRYKCMVDDWPDPGLPGPAQIRTRTLFSGVTNGTERNDLLGGNYAKPDEVLPAPWGYQNVGEVVEIGADVNGVSVGDIVFSSADHVEYALFDRDFLYCRVPAGVDLPQAALFGMTSVAMRTCRHADIRMGERVLVVGGGIIGQTAAQIVRAMGGRVDLCDIDPGRLALAKRIGAADTVLDVSGEGWAENIGDAVYNVILDLAGVPDMEDRLIAAAAFRGRILFIAGRRRVNYDFNMGQGREICIMQNSHFDNSDLANLARLVARGQVSLGPYIRDIVPVAAARDVYDTLRDHPEKLLGTVFTW